MDASKLSTLELLRLCLETQDESLWQEFVRRTQPVIARVVVKSIRHWKRAAPELVDDLVQDTYVKLFANNQRALRNFDCRHENALFGFVKTIANNVVQDHIRHWLSGKGGGGKADDDLESVAPSKLASNNSASTERKILIRQIARRLEKMLAGDPNSARDQAIFWFYYWQGFTANEISTLPGIALSVKGVESVLLRLTRGLGGTDPQPPKPAKPRPSNRSGPGRAAASSG